MFSKDKDPKDIPTVFLMTCLDLDVVEHTPDEPLELIWGRWRQWEEQECVTKKKLPKMAI